MTAASAARPADARRAACFAAGPPRSLVIGGSMIGFGSCSLPSSVRLIWTADPTALHLEASLLPPSLAHPFGTDNLGRDVLVRIIYGASIDLQIGLFSVLPPLIIGTPSAAWPATTARWPTSP